jgi:peptidoglycan/xylan/chitin deacetylase (PgdA/CDA1 family)
MPPGAPNVLVLCYHAISPTWPAVLSVTPSQFERQLRYLVSRGYRGVTFSEALSGTRDSPTLAVTFDDGFSSVRELAFPILDRVGLPGTVFVATGFVGTARPMAWPGIDGWLGTPHEPELRAMSWDDARFLAGAGWEIGSHTRSHPKLTELDDDALAEELLGSRQDCERSLDLPCRSVAYPYGVADARVVAAARDAGYRLGAGLRTPYRPDTGRWPRIGVYQPDTFARFRLKTSPALLRLRSRAVWRTLQSARQKLSGKPLREEAS